MNTLCAWLTMGGYASYVWPAYGLVASVLALIIVSVRVQKKQRQRQLLKWFKEQQ